METVALKTPIIKSAFELEAGDIFESYGERMAFVDFKMGGKSFVAQSINHPDKRYRVKVELGRKFTILGKATLPKVESELELLKTSPKGTLFVIKNRKTAELFSFESMTPSGKIKARNPLDNAIFTIDPNFPIKLVANIK